MVHILKLTKEYFGDVVEKKLYDEEACKSINNNFLCFLKKYFRDSFIDSNIITIQKFIVAHFYNIAEVKFEYDLENGRLFTLLPCDIKPKYESLLKPVINILNDNQNLIQYPYLDRNDQIAITDDLTKMIDLQISEYLEIEERKKLIRSATRRALDLNEKDIILFLKDKIVIKIFKKIDNLNPQVSHPKKRDVSEYRYKGYNYEELEHYYNEFFSDFKIEKFLEELNIFLLKNEFDFGVINNTYFEKYSLSLINSVICKKLEDTIEEHNDFITGFAGFIFRRHFSDIFEKICKGLIEKILSNDENAKSFFGYYNGETVVLEGKRYLLPSIVSENGEKWNTSSAIVSSNVWVNADKTIKIAQSKFDFAVEKLEKLIKMHTKALEKYETLIKKRDAVDEEIVILKEKLNQDMQSLKLEGEDSQKSENLKTKIKKDSALEEKLKQMMISFAPLIQEAYQKVQEQEKECKKQKEIVDSLQKELEAINANLSKTIEKYNHFLKSLVKAVTTKKQLLD